MGHSDCSLHSNEKAVKISNILQRTIKYDEHETHKLTTVLIYKNWQNKAGKAQSSKSIEAEQHEQDDQDDTSYCVENK